MLCCVFLLLLTCNLCVAQNNPNPDKGLDDRAISLIVFDNDDDDSDCTTPDSKKGRCDAISSCPGLYGVRDLNVLRKYICGYNGRSPLLCCPRDLRGNNQKPQPPKQTPTEPVNQPVPDGLRARRPSLFPENCGNTNASFTRVVGGVDAKRGDWPWQVLVLKKDTETGKFDSHCGASLLSQRHVISASHCFVLSPNKVTPADQFKVRLGEHDLRSSNDKMERNVAKLITHEKFEYGINTNDIALIVMDREVTFNKYVAPVCLPYSKEIIPDDITDKYVYITGWGRTRYLGKTANVLQQASFPIWNSKRCTDKYKSVHIDHVDNKRFICAGDETGIQDSCQGDSGGPLVRPEGFEPTRFYLVGIVSFGVRCATKGFPGVYTRVTNYLDWINGHLH